MDGIKVEKYAEIKALAKARKCPQPTLVLALLNMLAILLLINQQAYYRGFLITRFLKSHVIMTGKSEIFANENTQNI